MANANPSSPGRENESGRVEGGFKPHDHRAARFEKQRADALARNARKAEKEEEDS
jgi:hypothetical protein